MQFKPNALQHNDALLNCCSFFVETGGFVVFKYFSVGFLNSSYLYSLYFILYIEDNIIARNYIGTTTHQYNVQEQGVLIHCHTVEKNSTVNLPPNAS